MSIPKTPGRLTLDLKKYDKHQGRLLSNELKDIDAIRDRQEKSLFRDQMEIRRELWRLTEDKRKQQYKKQQQVGDRMKIETSHHGSAIAGRVSRHLNYNNQHSRRHENKAVQTPSTAERRMSPPIHPISLRPDSHRIFTITRESTLSQPKQLPKLHRPHSVSSASHNQTASMVSVISANKFAESERKLAIVAQASRLESRQPKNQAEEIEVVELNNQPATRTPKVYKSANKTYRPILRLYSRASIEIPTTFCGPEDEQPTADQTIPINDHIRDHTTKKLKQFLSDEGVDANKLPNGLNKLAEDIIALRNLGKTNDEVWQDVRSCRYLRGYDPPLMTLPDKNDPSQFVFGKSSKELYKQHLMRIARQVEAAKQKRDTEAKAATYTLTHTKDYDKFVVDRTQYRTYMKKFM